MSATRAKLEQVDNDGPTLWISIRQCWTHISRGSQIRFFFLLLLVLVATLSEALSIGALIPFVGLLLSPDKLSTLPVISWVIPNASEVDAQNLRLLLGSSFIGLVLLSACVRLMMIWVQLRLIHKIGNELCSKAFLSSLLLPYQEQVRANSNETASIIVTKTNEVAYKVVQPLLNLISSTVIILGMVSVIIYFEPLITFVVASAFLTIFALISVSTTPIIRRDSKAMSVRADSRMKQLIESLSASIDLTINSFQYQAAKKFSAYDLEMRMAQANINIISTWPRYIVEGLGIMLLAGLALLLSLRGDGLIDLLPFFAALALSAQRVLPLMQLAYSSFTEIRGAQHFLKSGMQLVAAPVEQFDPDALLPLKMAECIELKNVSFRHPGSDTDLFRDLTLSIPRGSMVGIVGPTGSGKSTLVSMLMGLLPPSEGCLLVDGVEVSTGDMRRRLQKTIAYVPQNVFITDADIGANVTFAVSDDAHDEGKIYDALKIACLDGFVAKQDLGLKQPVGENGQWLSGGQRQRLAIARAAYKDAAIVFFDEATSALDTITEGSVLDGLRKINEKSTVIFITHRLSAVETADIVFEVLDGGRVVERKKADGK